MHTTPHACPAERAPPFAHQPPSMGYVHKATFAGDRSWGRSTASLPHQHATEVRLDLSQSLICVTEQAVGKYWLNALCHRIVPAIQKSSGFLYYFTGLDCLICEIHAVFTVILRPYPRTLDFAVLDKHYSFKPWQEKLKQLKEALLRQSQISS